MKILRSFVPSLLSEWGTSMGGIWRGRLGEFEAGCPHAPGC